MQFCELDLHPPKWLAAGVSKQIDRKCPKNFPLSSTRGSGKGGKVKLKSPDRPPAHPTHCGSRAATRLPQATGRYRPTLLHSICTEQGQDWSCSCTRYGSAGFRLVSHGRQQGLPQAHRTGALQGPELVVRTSPFGRTRSMAF